MLRYAWNTFMYWVCPLKMTGKIKKKLTFTKSNSTEIKTVQVVFCVLKKVFWSCSRDYLFIKIRTDSSSNM